MIHIGTKCSKMPCIVEYKREDGRWDCCIFNDDEMVSPKVFDCEHEAFDQVAKTIITILVHVAMGKWEPEDVPRIEDFRLTRASGNAFREPAQHNDYVPNVDLAKRLIDKIKEGL